MARRGFDRIARILGRHPVEFAYVFGSAASGKAGPMSDLDLAVHFNPRLPPLRRARLRLTLLREISARTPKVDLVVLNDSALNLSFSAVQGRLLFSLNERRRIAFEASTRSRYFDRLYYIRRGAEGVLRRTASRGILGPW